MSVLGFFVPLGLSLHVWKVQVLIAASSVLLIAAGVFTTIFWKSKDLTDFFNAVSSFYKFFYASFLKPHTGDGDTTGQQAALESFYKVQADVYDATRGKLLRGRQDMLGLVAAQLKYKAAKGAWSYKKPIWVDVGGGTGWNIEAMGEVLDVPTFFEGVYLVDLSTSLCEVAQKRFARLGWTNVKVVCQDARSFRLEQHTKARTEFRVFNKEGLLESDMGSAMESHADLITFSYSLSMIPDYYSVVDSISSLLSPSGLVGVVDFYVQSVVETSGRNYIGGSIQRHVNWVSRNFWRAWFELDRVGLEGAKRDYLEYRFGTLKSVDERNYLFSGLCIPYYIFLGVAKLSPSASSDGDPIGRLDAACTESPYLSPRQHRLDMSHAADAFVRSKAYDSAVINLSANLPLPSTFYQNHTWRIYYDEHHQKHTRFNNKYIYAFTWEDSRVDQRLLKICSDDVVLCISSAGDNLLDYLISSNPKRIHAVDLNPSQNHLLELKIAAFQSLSYSDFWRLFGEGKHRAFRELLINNISPHMSSQAFQFWWSHASVFASSGGLFESGGSGYAIKLVRWLFWVSGLRPTVKRLCEAKTLNEQRELWLLKIRKVLMSRVLHWIVIGGNFLWKAAGVPPAQRAMIVSDHLDQEGLNPFTVNLNDNNGEAMWEYIENTLAPVAQETLISDDNFYYLLALQGKYSRRCHPPYLSAKAHAKLSRPGAFDGLRIHTDEINEVISRIAPRTLTIAVIMDSMDWFDPGADAATIQIRALNRALKLGGRVLLRSAGLKPWYVATFEALGFISRRVGARLPGTCIDRVNMYASTWILTKTMNLESSKPPFGQGLERVRPTSTVSTILEQLEI